MRFGRRRKKRPSILKGVLAGAIGGAAGTAAMNYAHIAWNKAEAKLQEGDGTGSAEQSGEPATAKTAGRLTESFLDRPLTSREKAIAAQIVHWSMGSGSGAVYGGLAARYPAVASGAGLPFGLTLWAVADEIAVPAAGLSPPPGEVSATMHTKALAAHLVYGLVTELVRRRVVRILGDPVRSR